MPRKIHINHIYRHFKGDYYLVRGIVKHSETEQKYRFELQDIKSKNV